MELQRKLRELKNPSYLQSSTTMLLFFASWGIWWSFFQLWLTSEHNGLGLSGSAVGTIFSINSITSRDKEMCKNLKEWIQSLRKFSTMISESGEMQRIQFFKKQRELVEKM